MFKFFSENYNQMRKDKITAYHFCYIYHPTINETNKSKWPINYYPSFHSFSELGLQFLGIFLKPILCVGLASWFFYEAFVSGLAVIGYTVFLNFDESYNHLKNSIYFTAEVFYLLTSAILDILLAVLSFSIRCISTLGTNLATLVEEEIIIQKKERRGSTPKVEEMEVSNLGSAYVSSGSSNIKAPIYTLTTSGFSDLFDEETRWHNSPVF